MAILHGRNGQVRWDATGVGSPSGTLIVSLNKWSLSMKTDKVNVTSFGDTNKVYVPGLPDLSGSISGFYNSAEMALFTAASSSTPGSLELIPNSTEPTFYWRGNAYMDANIDVPVDGAPTISGDWVASGAWVHLP